MHIEDFKTWHWILIGLVVGLLIGGVKLYQGPWFDNGTVATLGDQARFELALLGKLPIDAATQVTLPATAPAAGAKPGAKPPKPRVVNRYPPGVTAKGSDRYTQRYHHGQPLIKDLVVHPPVAGGPPRSYWVTGKMYEVDLQHMNEADPNSPVVPFESWVPFNYEAKAPYVGTYVAKGRYPTVTEYLAAASKDPEAKFVYRYSWWEGSAATLALPACAGLLVIGFAWPLMINLMQRGGMAPLPQPKAKLPKNRKMGADKRPVDHTAGDKQLDELNAALEAEVAGFASTSTDPDDSSVPMPTVKTLAGADPMAPSTPATPEEIVEYGGEFYPVVKAIHGKDEPPATKGAPATHNPPKP